MSKATVVLPDREFVVDIDARDRRAFERQKDIDVPPTGGLREVAARMPETYLAWLAWHAAGREGEAITWADFDEQLVEIRQDEQGADLPDPTQAIPTAG